MKDKNRKQLNLYESTALIVSGTVGAGVLGIPFVVAKVGLMVGLVYIVVFGVLMTGLNLLIGEVLSKLKTNLQLVGLARKYLGRFGEFLMMSLVYSMAFGVLVVYIIGEGQALATLFGGSIFIWSILFFVFATALIFVGMGVIKKVELITSLGLILIVVLIVFLNFSHFEVQNLVYVNWKFLFVPYGVLLFAYSGLATIPEAKSIIKGDKRIFKKSIILAGLINILIYSLFTLVVVGVTGADTTEIATIGLGYKVGPIMLILGNVFAVTAMGNSFLLTGLALKDSFMWDFKMPKLLASIIVSVLPIILFLAGIRGFIQTIDVIGGVFLSSQMLLVLLIYWRAKQLGDLKTGRFKLHHVLFLIIILLLTLSGGIVYSILKWF
ncbi:MAG: hypothetical protein L3J07_02535 [Candidatus Magasanikbacteria bacterium]|nr:hypothetical protein [Candidatus Magasanikbacteria bacterium]